MKPTQILVDEHNLIRQAIDNFALAVEKLERDERPPKEFFEKGVDFVRNFADKHHHFKEEYLMFGRLAEKKKGKLDAQIDSLRYQHDRGRDLIGEIAGAIDGYSRGEDAQTTILLENLAAYVSLLRSHIHKEDHGFYPMVDEALSEDEQKMLLDEFEKEDSKTGGNVFEDSRKLVMEIGTMV